MARMTIWQKGFLAGLREVQTLQESGEQRPVRTQIQHKVWKCMRAAGCASSAGRQQKFSAGFDEGIEDGMFTYYFSAGQ